MARAVSDRRLTLLVVDDEESMRDIIKGCFDSKCFNFHEAANGLEALTLLKEHRFDCVISDVRMPQMNGSELLKRFKLIQFDLPVLLVTGYMDLLEMDAFELGAEGVFLKPFSRDELGAAVLQRVAARELNFPAIPKPGRLVSKSFTLPQAEVSWKDFKLGRGGFFLGMSERFRLNEVARFELAFPADNFVLKCDGIVRWTRNATADLPGGYGVEIVGLDESSKAHIRDVIQKNKFTPHIPRG